MPRPHLADESGHTANTGPRPTGRTTPPVRCTTRNQGNTMYEYEIYRSTSAELIRRADTEREIGRARRARRAARRTGRHDPEGRVRQGDRSRFAPAA
ncbi:hypothetical protein GCM10010253_33600 [Streptomyces badius]|uniref:Uncharacterized protein n=2 Tax=Streptomyces badius TaxID=1941 RepID=A0ABQ2TB49_STRBA|nr:hypothetical protein GCM10010253_33600 [Streptomyces badius]